LQGGTQYNLAAFKAQVDYIKEHVKDAKVSLHPHCGEAGAIGAALEARDSVNTRGYSKFVGLKEALYLEYTTKTDASTQCHFCPMNCNRTFIDTKTPSSKTVRYIAGFKCEKGTVESIKELQEVKAKREELNKELFEFNYDLKPMPSQIDKVAKKVSFTTLGGWGPTLNFKIKSRFKRSNQANLEYRQNLKIAMPRVLNIYSKAPFSKERN